MGEEVLVLGMKSFQADETRCCWITQGQDRARQHFRGDWKRALLLELREAGIEGWEGPDLVGCAWDFILKARWSSRVVAVTVLCDWECEGGEGEGDGEGEEWSDLNADSEKLASLSKVTPKLESDPSVLDSHPLLLTHHSLPSFNFTSFILVRVHYFYRIHQKTIQKHTHLVLTMYIRCRDSKALPSVPSPWWQWNLESVFWPHPFIHVPRFIFFNFIF